MAQAKTKSPPKRKKSTSSRKPSSGKQANSSKPAPVAAVSNAAEKATNAAGNAAEKAKMPLVAGSAALAGVASGVVLGTRHAHRHSRMDKAIKLAHELQQVRQPHNGSRRRSPVEVVLEGLTTRRSRA